MNRVHKYLLNISLFLCFVFSVFAVLPLKKVVDKNTWIKGNVQISAHRGGAALNPENTMKAFDYVIMETDYTDIVELDLRVTKDKVIVINHDEDINRMALDNDNKAITIKENEYNELINYNLGKNFIDLNGNKPYYDYSLNKAKEEGLTLMKIEDFFSRYNMIREFKVFLEIKSSDEDGKYIVDKLIEMFNGDYGYWKDRSMFITFDDNLLDYIVDEYDSQYVGALGDKVAYQIAFEKMGLDCFYYPKYHSLQVPYNKKAKSTPLIELASKGMVESAHKRNQLITYWGVNEKEDMERLINIGVDVITTDRPDILANLLDKELK